MKSIAHICFSILLFQSLYSQCNSASESITLDSLNTILNLTYSNDYNIIEFIYIDENGLDRTQSSSYLREDKNHNLSDSYIGLIENTDKDFLPIKHFVGVFRKNQKMLMSLPIPVTKLRLDGYADVNNDGLTDIIMTEPLGVRYNYEGIWILSIDSNGCRFLNEIENGEDTNIKGPNDSFDFYQKGKDGTLIITCSYQVDDSDDVKKEIYCWNLKISKYQKKIDE